MVYNTQPQHNQEREIIQCESLPRYRTEMKDRESLPELAANHVVLGRYNGMKTKPLNDLGVTKAYRKFRKGIHRKRTYDDQAAEDLRLNITRHISEELRMPDLQIIVFVVDIQRIKSIKDRQHQDDIWKANPKMFYNRAEGIIFVEDKTNYFFKQELKEKRHQPARTPTPTPPPAISPSPTFDIYSTNHTSPIPHVYPTEPSLPPHNNPTATPPFEDEMNLSDDDSALYDEYYLEMMKTDIVEMSGSDTEGMSSDLDMDHRMKFTNESPSTVMKFEFAKGEGTLEQQINRCCAHFCRNNIDPNNDLSMDEIHRKSAMVRSFQSRFETFQHLLSVNPFAGAPSPLLRDLPELLLIQCATVMLNGMIEAYQQSPTSCLEGEANAWTGNTGQAENPQPQTSVVLGQSTPTHRSHSLAPDCTMFSSASFQQSQFSCGLGTVENTLAWIPSTQDHSQLPVFQRKNGEMFRSLEGLLEGLGDDEATSDTCSLLFVHDAGKQVHKKGKKQKGDKLFVIKAKGALRADNKRKEDNQSQVSSSCEHPPLRSQEELYRWFVHRLRREKIYRKNVTSFIRKAIKGERVVTAIDGKQETKYQVKDDKSWLVCGKAAGEYYILTDQQFKTNYDIENATEISIDNPYPLAKRLRQQGFMEYRSSRKVWASKVTEKDMDFFRHGIDDETNSGTFFMAPWGESMMVEEGDYIVMQYPESNKEIYRIEHRVFHDSYCDDAEPEKKEEKKQPIVLSSATFAVGAAVLVAALVLPKLMFSMKRKA